MPRCISLSALFALALTAGLATASAQTSKHSFLTGTIDDTKTVTISGNVRPEMTAENDRGLRADSTPMTGLQLVLHRSPENQTAFTKYLAQLSDPASPNFHQWLTNAQIGSKFGPSANDISRVAQWLTDKGFVVHAPSPDGSILEFDGNAGLVRHVFHAPIHNLNVNGVTHFANGSDPELPEALTPVVSGIASLNDFMPHVQSHRKTAAPAAHVQGNGGNGYNYLAAADIATIYNFNPLFAQGITGKGVTIVLIEDTDQYSIGDWQIFRKEFGLSRAYPYASLTDSNPSGTNTCTDPGVVTGDDVEASIDVDWASAAAPNATLINAACKDTTQFGGFLALSNLLQVASPPKVVSISYGEAESELGATENAYIANLYSTAVAEGVSVFVSSGDEGAASVDADRTNATRGIAVSGYTSTPYDVSVGGTDFGYTPLGDSGTFFSSTNLTNFRTALSYIPEIPWNDSCAGSLITSYLGYPRTGTGSLCNSSAASAEGLLTTASGSGGPSGCATGTYATGERYVVSGTCKGYTKPSWQSLVGVPSDGVRDIPDVSLFASNGFWGVYYAVCNSNPKDADSPCTADPSTWPGYGGTSISSPIWAGIQALVNQTTGTSWGNSNPVLYSLANTAYGSTGNSGCNSSLGTGTSSSCVFYDVTAGDNAVNCSASTATASAGTWDCYINGGTYGVLSTSNTSLQPAYSSTTGYDFTSGIGTTNATNLVTAWSTYASAAAIR